MNRLIRFKKAFLCLTGVISVAAVGVTSLLYFKGDLNGPDWLDDNNSPFEVNSVKNSTTKDDIINTLKDSKTKVTITDGTCTTKEDVIKGLEGKDTNFETCKFKYAKG